MGAIEAMKLNANWIAAPAQDVEWNGIQLTTTHPPSSSAMEPPWIPAVVPGTILTTLLENKLILDPFYGLENKNIIDIADAGREYYTFWFFTKFDLSMIEGTRAWLQFRAINYQADVFLNGHWQILQKGMFRRHLLDITDWSNLKGSNLLAVLVHPPDHPGRIPPKGGQGGDHDIGKDVAAQYVEGWDWMDPVRDRNTGIWDEVSISFTGPVKISDPHLVSSFIDNLKKAYLHTSIELKNTSSQPVHCMLKLLVSIELEGDTCLLENLMEQDLIIPGDAATQYTFPPLLFSKPQLWWPNGMGKQSLYQIDIIVEVHGFGESDSWSHLFGFRKIESYIDPSTGGRLFEVNEEPVFIRGGNWIVSDGLLRLSDERYRSDIDFHADMNFNMIRCWGGGIAERPEFYQNCDRRGLLVWQEFWITGDCDGRGLSPSNPDWPLDHQLFLTCARDTIKLLRNYASLGLWVGGNEQHPSSDINTTLMNDLQLHPFFKIPAVLPSFASLQTFEDPSQYLDGTRVYIQGSLWDGFAKGDGSFSDGPYSIQNPEDFFKDDFYAYGFNPEVGSVGVPVAATIRATMPPEAWQFPEFVKMNDGYIKEVPNSTWDYHKYIPYSDPGKVRDQIEIYGEPTDLSDFCEKAQVANYVQYRALMEGWNSRMWTKYTGVLIWKNQNPWTGLRGQFYDHLHDQTGGFFGVQSACESIHIQLNLVTFFIEVVNNTSAPLANVDVECTIWDLDGVSPYHHLIQGIVVPSKKTLSIFEIQYPKSEDAKPVYFLLLKLINKSLDTLLSRNFYWLHLPGADYKLLQGDFKLKKIPIRTTIKEFLPSERCRIHAEIENLSSGGQTRSQVWQMQDRVMSDVSVLDKGEISNEYNSPSLLCNFSTQLPLMEKGSSPRSECTEIINSSLSSGVAFWLHFSVFHVTENLQPGIDRRILPVNYSHNFFSLVPGEKINVELSFKSPMSGMAKLVLEGWNINESQVYLKFA